MEHFSEFPGYDGAGDTHDLKTRLKEFFVAEYLIRIERDELHILYDSDVVFVFPGSEGPDEPDEPEVGDESDSERVSRSPSCIMEGLGSSQLTNARLVDCPGFGERFRGRGC